MAYVEVEAALHAWRAAEQQLRDAPGVGPEHQRAEALVMHRRALYQRAVLGARGRMDALEAASELTRDRLMRSRELIARSHELTNVIHDPLQIPRDDVDGAASADLTESSEA
jgi:hypothetical protein